MSEITSFIDFIRSHPDDIALALLMDCRSGAAWRDLPERYGAWSTVYSRFARWQEDGLFEKILKELGEEADPQDMSLDSSCVKAHQASAGAKKGL